MNEKQLEFDRWVMKICETVAERSKCLSRKVGAVLVQDGTIICQGFNGPPRGVPHCDERYKCDEQFEYMLMKMDGMIPSYSTCPRQALDFKSGEGLEWCIAGHGERNVLINAARQGIATKGATMYMNCSTPCAPCLVEIINAGISRIVCTELDYYDLMSEWLVKNSHLEVTYMEE